MRKKVYLMLIAMLVVIAALVNYSILPEGIEWDKESQEYYVWIRCPLLEIGKKGRLYYGKTIPNKTKLDYDSECSSEYFILDDGSISFHDDEEEVMKRIKNILGEKSISKYEARKPQKFFHKLF